MFRFEKVDEFFPSEDGWVPWRLQVDTNAAPGSGKERRSQTDRFPNEMEPNMIFELLYWMALDATQSEGLEIKP